MDCLRKANALRIKFLERFGVTGGIRLIFYPFTVFLVTPVRLIQALWSSRVLLKGKWYEYSHFNFHSGINSLFYWTAAINFHWFGRSGESPYVGINGRSLAHWFHYSLPSLYAFWKASNMTLLTGMFGWLSAHFVWVGECEIEWLLLILGFVLGSTTFYANIFGPQNYNVVGWMFFPIGLYALITKQWVIAGIVWFFASFGSFTVVFIGGIFSFVFAASSWTVAPLMALIPAFFKLGTHFWPYLIKWNINALSKTLTEIMKAIGMTEYQVKYQRTDRRLFSFINFYYFIIYGQFIIFDHYFSGSWSIIVVTAFVVFVLNASCIRFADIQSMYILLTSVAVVEMLQQPEPWQLISFCILLSPLPRLMPISSQINTVDIIPKASPFSIKILKNDMERFFEPIQSGERVLMAFNDPKDQYANVFDGYRFMLELPVYVATIKKIHFLPNWWAVFELNYMGAPDFWGRNVASVIENMKYWQADYVVIYQDPDTEIEKKWEKAGFDVLRVFHWPKLNEKWKTEKIRNYKNLTWWLLKLKE